MLTLLLVVALVYVAFVGGLYFFQRTLMYLPGPPGPPPAAAGVPELREVRLETVDGLRPLAWYGPPVRSDGLTILYLHGNAGNLAARAFKIRPMLDAGHGLLLLSWRGYGDNAGTPTEEGLYRDARAAIRFLDGKGVRHDRLVLYGESLGSGVAVQMATEMRPGAVILEAPFSSIADVGAMRYPLVPVRWLVKDRYDSAAKIASVEAPILILHGEDDAVVPLRLGRKLFEEASEPKRFHAFPEGRHENLYDLGAGRKILAFLADVAAPLANTVTR